MGEPNPFEVIRNRIRESRQIFLVSVIVVTGFVALIAFLASYQHQYELVIRHHQTHWVAGLYPLSVDLLIVAATMVIWYAASQGWGRPWGAWLVLLVGIAATAIANLAADDPEGWNGIGPFISIWPAVAFLGAYEMAVWVVRKRRKEQEPRLEISVQPELIPQTIPASNGNGSRPPIQRKATR